MELKEFYDNADIILANLSTTSGDRLLETAGMIYLDASSNGQKIEIRPDKQIVVHFPKAADDYKEMNLFYADENATDTAVSNWVVDTVKLVKKTLSLGGYGWWYPSEFDSTPYDFIPKNFVDTGYYWNPLDFYVRSYNFTEATMNTLEKLKNRNDYKGFESWNGPGVECELVISENGRLRNIKINTKVPSFVRQEILQFLRGLPQLKPGRNRYDEIIERRGLLYIISGDVVPIYQTDKAYVKSFDRKYSKYEKSPIQNMDDAELNFYVFSISKLGWINCDRFYDVPETVDVLAQIPVNPSTKLMMAFSDIKSMMAPTIVDGKYVFSKVPKGQAVTVIAIKNEDGKLQTAFQKTILGDKPIDNFAFSETSLAKLREELNGI